MYVCGPTVYDETHIGHARCYVAFDVIRRFFEYLGYNVKMVVNITDIDDKIIRRAWEEKVSWREISEKYTKDFFEAIKILNIKPATHYPKASEHIKDMINMIEKLISKGYAYVAEDNTVYLSIEKIPKYGELSGQKIEELIAGARVEPGPYKRNPLDFALWKPWKPREPWWDTPWCPGRPGWHTECVIMSVKYLGEVFDIHGGGQDLIFPHHENELAIAKAFLGMGKFARYWIHVGLLMIRGEKMSKSLHNIIPVREIVRKYDPELVRACLAVVHYRKPLNFSFELLEELKPNIKTMYRAYYYLAGIIRRRGLDVEGILEEKEAKIPQNFMQIVKEFEEAMCQDFNTSKAFSSIIAYAKQIIARLGELEKLGEQELVGILSKYLRMCDVLGLLYKRIRIANPYKVLEKLIDLILDLRCDLRAQRRWDIADRIRDILKVVGVEVEDRRDRSYWSWSI